MAATVVFVMAALDASAQRGRARRFQPTRFESSGQSDRGGDGGDIGTGNRARHHVRVRAVLAPGAGPGSL